MKQPAERERIRAGTSARWRSFAFPVAMSLACGACQFAQLGQLAQDGPICHSRCDDLSSRLGREVNLNRRWQNHRLSELVSALGQPLMLLSIPGGGNPPGFVAFYGVDPQSGCIDAFAFVYDTDPIVRVYHCR